VTALLWTASAIVLAAALLAGCEILARAWIVRRGGYAVWRPGHRLHMHTDRAVLPSQEALVRFEINSEGERGGESPADVRGTYRVLVAGGSAAECYFLDQPSTWPEVLKRELSAPAALARLGAAHVHVGSIGRSLVSAESIDEVLTKVLPRYEKLDLVVFMIGAANVANWLAKGAPPAIEEKSAAPAAVFDVHPYGPFGLRPGKSGIGEILRRLRAKHLRPIEVRQGAGARLAKAREMRRKAATIVTAMPDPAPMLDHFERRFREMLADVRRRVPRVLVVRQPWFRKDRYSPGELEAFWHGAAGNPYAGAVTTYYSFDVVSRLVDLMDRRVEAVCRDVGIEQVDLMPLLEPSLATFYDFWHFTPAGGAVIGKAVADAVLSRKAVEPAAADSARR
jgi:hypothetical protein